MVNDEIVWATIAGGWCVTVPLGIRHLRRAGPVAAVPAAWLLASVPWAVAAARGQGLAGHSHAITLLTAAHFLHAGFAVATLLVITSRGRWLVVHQAGMVLVALGIDGRPALEPIGAAAIVAALGALAAGAARRAGTTHGARRVGLVLLTIGWWYPMVLALGWALARDGHPIVVRTLDEMVVQHGSVNALTVTAGLAAWPVVTRPVDTHRAALRDTATNEEVAHRVDPATTDA